MKDPTSSLTPLPIDPDTLNFRHYIVYVDPKTFVRKVMVTKRDVFAFCTIEEIPLDVVYQGGKIEPLFGGAESLKNFIYRTGLRYFKGFKTFQEALVYLMY